MSGEDYIVEKHTMVILSSSVLWLIFFTISTADAIEFVNEPRNVTVTEGETAYFPCEYRGTNVAPSWRIGGLRYASTSLPRGYRENLTGLIVPHVTQEMNGISISCYFQLGTKVTQSSTGYIIIAESVTGWTSQDVAKSSLSVKIRTELFPGQIKTQMFHATITQYATPLPSPSTDVPCLLSPSTGTKVTQSSTGYIIIAESVTGWTSQDVAKSSLSVKIRTELFPGQIKTQMFHATITQYATPLPSPSTDVPCLLSPSTGTKVTQSRTGYIIIAESVTGWTSQDVAKSSLSVKIRTELFPGQIKTQIFHATITQYATPLPSPSTDVPCLLSPSTGTKVTQSSTGYIIIAESVTGWTSQDVAKSSLSVKIRTELFPGQIKTQMFHATITQYATPLPSPSTDVPCLLSPSTGPHLTSAPAVTSAFTTNNRRGPLVYLSIGLPVMAIVGVTVTVSLIICKGHKRRAVKCEEPVYDVPSWPCEDDVRTEGNVAYGSVLGGMPACSSARRMVHLEHSQEETSRDKGDNLYEIVS